jgi:hypothetical protein
MLQQAFCYFSNIDGLSGEDIIINFSQQSNNTTLHQ